MTVVAVRSKTTISKGNLLRIKRLTPCNFISFGIGLSGKNLILNDIKGSLNSI